MANCFVAVTQDSTTIAGYYALSASSILLGDLTDEFARRLPRYPLVPAALIGRLAVNTKFQSQGLGGALLYDAIERAARSDAAIYAILVDAKDENAAGFYLRYGFQRFSSRPGSLFLPIATVRKLL